MLHGSRKTAAFILLGYRHLCQHDRSEGSMYFLGGRENALTPSSFPIRLSGRGICFRSDRAGVHFSRPLRLAPSKSLLRLRRKVGSELLLEMSEIRCGKLDGFCSPVLAFLSRRDRIGVSARHDPSESRSSPHYATRALGLSHAAPNLCAKDP
jgi:hypothetical protein